MVPSCAGDKNIIIFYLVYHSFGVASCGVPKGNVLGPLLFSLYINDFQNCSKIFDFHLFADDANLFYANINDWLCANK
jgi:hypothetical protein